MKKSRTKRQNNKIQTVDDFYRLTADLDESEFVTFTYEFFKPKKRLGLWGRIFFPHIIETNEIADFHLELTENLSSPGHSALVEPRGHGKSTWMKIDTIHDIVYELEPFIVYISNTREDAKMHFAAIKAELENNDLILDIYGDFVPPESLLSRKWSDSHFQTTNGTVCIARGAGKGRGLNIKNKRPTKVILDDIEDDEQVKSAERRAKLQHWIFSVIMPTLHRKQGRMKWVGTILSPECELLKFYKKFGGVFRKAIENGKALWPEVWDLESLEKKKEDIGTRAFSQEYLNTPVNDELSIIKKVWLEKSAFSVIDRKGLKLIITIDPQSGQSANADNCGIALLGFYPKDKHRYILDIKLSKGEQTDQARDIIKLWHENKDQVLVVGAEVVLTQVAVFQLIVNWKNRKIEIAGLENITDRNIPIRSVSPGGKNKLERLRIHEPAFERGEVHIHQGLESFMTNLTAFPEVAHDDDVDAMIYALDLSYKINPLQTSTGQVYNQAKSGVNTIVGNLKKKTF